MSNIEQNLQKILSTRFGKNVRQAIHDGIHDCYEDGKAGAVDLVAREQIANLVANNNPTDGNSELIDIRVGADSTVYGSAGEAVREQVSSLKENLGELNCILEKKEYKNYKFNLVSTSLETGVYDKYFTLNDRTGVHCSVSVSDGEIYKLSGFSYADDYPLYLLIKNEKVVNYYKPKSNSPFCDLEIVIKNADTLVLNGKYSLCTVRKGDESIIMDKEKLSAKLSELLNKYEMMPVEIIGGVYSYIGYLRSSVGKHVSIAVKPYESYCVTGRTLAYDYPMFLFIGNNKVISYQKEYEESTKYTDIKISIPDGCDTLIVQSSVSDIVIKKAVELENIYSNAIVADTVITDLTYIDGIIRWNGEITTVFGGVHAEYAVSENDTLKISAYKYGTSGSGSPAYLLCKDDVVVSTSGSNGDPEALVDKEIIIQSGINKIILNGRDTSDISIAIPLQKQDTKEYIDKQVANVVDDNDNYWSKKKIVWFGTSIPAGVVNAGESGGYGSYPSRIGKMLGATVYNESVGSSAVRFGNYQYVKEDDPHGIRGQWPENFFYSLSASSSEKQAYFNEWNTNWGLKIGVGTGDDRTLPYTITDDIIEKALNCSYDKKIDRYLTGGEVGQVDLYVFDHGHNEEFGGDYSHIKDLPSTDDSQNRSYFIGAMSFIINRIISDNPRAKIVFIGHYENDRKTGISEAQIALYNKWKYPLIKTWEYMGWSQNKIGDKTITQIWMPDNLHPASDKTGEALQHYANVLYPLIRDIR